MIRLPDLRRPLLLATGLYAVAFFLWLGVEDSTVLPAAVFGGAAAALGLAHFLRIGYSGRGFTLAGWFALMASGGAAAGAASALVAVLFMAMKVSLHSHTGPDYSLEAVVGVLARAPQWGIAGLLCGLGLGLIGLARQRG